MKRKYLLSIFLALIAVSSCSLFDKKKTEDEKTGTFSEEKKKDVTEQMIADEKKRERLIGNGKQAPALIDAIQDTREPEKRHLRLRLYLNVRPKGEDNFNAVIEIIVTRFTIPHVGEKVVVFYNPDDKTDLIMQ